MPRYVVHIWRAVYHDDEFSHHCQRSEVVTAPSKTEARKMVAPRLTRGSRYVAGGGLVVESSDEYVYGVDDA